MGQSGSESSMGQVRVTEHFWCQSPPSAVQAMAAEPPSPGTPDTPLDAYETDVCRELMEIPPRRLRPECGV